MGVVDRVRQRQQQKARQAENSHPDSPGQSSLVLADPPHIARLKGVLSTLHNFIKQNRDGSHMATMGIIMTGLGNELAEELADMDEMQIRIFLAQIGEVIAWIGHGNNDRLPDSVRMFAEMVQPSATATADTGSDAPFEIGTPAR